MKDKINNIKEWWIKLSQERKIAIGIAVGAAAITLMTSTNLLPDFSNNKLTSQHMQSKKQDAKSNAAQKEIGDLVNIAHDEKRFSLASEKLLIYVNNGILGDEGSNKISSIKPNYSFNDYEKWVKKKGLKQDDTSATEFIFIGIANSAEPKEKKIINSFIDKYGE